MSDEEREESSGFDFSIMAKLNLAVEDLAAEMRLASQRQLMLSQNIWALSLPTLIMPGVTSVLDRGEQLGPRTGQVWDLRRISVSGMTTGTLNVRLDDTTSGEIIAQFTNAGVTTYGKGQATIVAGRRLVFQATGTGTAATIYVAGIQLSASVFADYLL